MRHWPKFGQPTKWKLYMQIVVVLAQRWYDVVEPTKQKHVFQCISFCLPNVSPIQQSLSYSSCWCAHCAPNANCQTVNCSTIDQTGLYKTESTVEPKGGSRTVWKICWLCFCKCWLHNTHIYTLIVVKMQCLQYVYWFLTVYKRSLWIKSWRESEWRESVNKANLWTILLIIGGKRVNDKSFQFLKLSFY